MADENINLNNPSGNLNPPINPNSPPPIQPKYPKLPVQNAGIVGETNKEERKEKMIENWNNSPKVKETGVKAIDTDKDTEISKRKARVLWFLAGIGVLALLGITFACGMVGYTLYEKGSITSPISLICGNLTGGPVTCEKQDCTNTCTPTLIANYSGCPACSPVLNCGNSTS